MMKAKSDYTASMIAWEKRGGKDITFTVACSSRIFLTKSIDQQCYMILHFLKLFWLMQYQFSYVSITIPVIIDSATVGWLMLMLLAEIFSFD